KRRAAVVLPPRVLTISEGTNRTFLGRPGRFRLFYAGQDEETFCQEKIQALLRYAVGEVLLLCFGQGRRQRDPDVCVLILITDEGDFQPCFRTQVTNKEAEGGDRCIKPAAVVSEGLGHFCHERSPCREQPPVPVPSEQPGSPASG